MNGYQGRCDVCGKETEVFVGASTMGVVSWAYCLDCLNAGLEPYHSMVVYIACAGRFPDDINKEYQDHCRHILKGLGISEEQFVRDVDKSIKDMEDYSNMCQAFDDFE